MCDLITCEKNEKKGRTLRSENYIYIYTKLGAKEKGDSLELPIKKRQFCFFFLLKGLKRQFCFRGTVINNKEKKIISKTIFRLEKKEIKPI